MAIKYENLKILIADDFSSFRNTVNSMLIRLGVQGVDMVSTGEEVLNACKQKTYDIILCDFDLGPGRNGQQVLEQLRFDNLINWRTAFIMVSAESSRNIVMSAFEYVPDDFLMKPVTAQMIQLRMERFLQIRTRFIKVYSAFDKDEKETAMEELMNIVVEEDRFSVMAQKILGELFLEAKQFKKAEKLYTKVLEVRPLDWARLGLAKVKLLQGDHDIAQQWLGKIVEENPLYLPAYDALAESCEQKGDLNQTQKIFEKATSVSPMSILRQKKLGQVAKKNGDLGVALKAMRKTVKLGTMSCYGSADDTVDLVETLLENTEYDSENIKDLLAEAEQALLKVEKDYEIKPELRERVVLLKSDVLDAYDSASKQTDKKAHALRAKTLSQIDKDLAEVEKLLAKGDEVALKKFLLTLQRKYANDEEALKKLDQYLDEPASKSNREYVARVNKKGIGMYTDGLFNEAINCFEDARKLFPKHSGIQLNIVQSLIGLYRQDKKNLDLFEKCDKALKDVSEIIDEKHANFVRYSKLRQLVDATHKQASTQAG